MQSSKVFLADKLSVLPVMQQAVGIGTVLSNIIKVIGCLIAVKALQSHLDARSLENGNQSINDKVRKIIAKQKNELKREPTMQEIKAAASAELSKEDYSSIEKLTGYRARLKRSLEYIGIGLLRATPIAGTIYASVVWYRGKSY